MNEKVYDEWLKINVEIHNKLEKLKELDKEREKIIKEAENKEINEEQKEKINRSIKLYEMLLEEIKTLSAQAKELKEKIGL